MARIPDYWAQPEVKFETNNKLRYLANETVEVECVTEGGFPPPNITWFINGEKVNTLHEIKRDIHKVEI